MNLDQLLCPSLRTYELLRHSGTSVSFGVPAEPDEKRSGPSIDALDTYALERWEVCDIWDGSLRQVHRF